MTTVCREEPSRLWTEFPAGAPVPPAPPILSTIVSTIPPTILPTILPAILPTILPSPFDELGPHPLARAAADTLMADLAAHGASLVASGGKMFGVLVACAPGGGIGFLRAFSGTIDGRQDLPGFVPPMFDAGERAAFEPDGERRVKLLSARARASASSSELARSRSELADMQRRHDEERAAVRARHAQSRGQRRAARVAVASSGAGSDAAAAVLAALAQQSRRDKSEKRRLDAWHAGERSVLEERARRLERRAAAHARLSAMAARSLMRRIHQTYRVTNARGQTRPLRSLFAPGEPPSGAGDCAAPKLLAYALANGFHPIALAEFWWGAPPAAGARVAGAFYPACREKCGPLLPFLLDGIEVAAPRRFTPPDASRLEMPILYEDEWLFVLDKPCGLLSAPSPSSKDCVAARLAAAGERTPLVAHRLDLDTSGLLVVARDVRTYKALQRQFVARSVDKRYVAIVDGDVRERAGVIDLPIRVDAGDRPRQIHDPVHGRPAWTEWTVLHAEHGPRQADGQDGGRQIRTRVALVPRTGRTHQLRVHAAHPLGLGSPIVGDRLYGREAERLMLHAESLSFVHPASGERVTFESPVPF